MQTKLRTYDIVPNNNISFPIGTILTVEKLYNLLDLPTVFGKHKTKGVGINKLLKALVSYKLTDNYSIRQAHEWINQDEVLDVFELDTFNRRALYRVLGTIGANKDEIMSDIQDRLFERYEFEHTNINMDWTSIVLHGDKAPLGKYGYSRDHRPDKKQITLGISELAYPINIPIAMTIEPGNLNDQKHFRKTYFQSRSHLKKGSLVVFDKGAHSIENTDIIRADDMQYLTAKKLNKSDDKIIARYEEYNPELIDSNDGVYGIKIVRPSSTDYLYFSEKLQKEQLESKARKIYRQIDEARELQEVLDKNKKIPKRFKVNNALIDVSYSFQTKLVNLSEEEAIKLLEEKIITGREGYFCFKSSKNLTLKQALLTYRKKDSIEKIFHSLKNEIDIKPLRMWTDDSIYGALMIGFIAQLFISVMRYEFEELKHVSTKFIKNVHEILRITCTNK